VYAWEGGTCGSAIGKDLKVRKPKTRVSEGEQVKNTAKPIPPFSVYGTAFILSAAMLAYEILLVRMASVLLTSQYLFLIIGISLLGVSVGAILEYRSASRSTTTNGTLAMWLGACSLSLLGSTVLVATVGGSAGVLLLVLSVGTPFVLSGFVLSRLFRLASHIAGYLYAADLAGAAIGSLFVPLLIPSLGPLQSVVFISLILAGFSALIGMLTHPSRAAGALWALTLTVGVTFFLNRGNALLGDVPVGQDPNKDLYRLTNLMGRNAAVVESRWSTFGRTDLVRFDNDSSLMTIFVDGAAGANMLRFDGGKDTASSGTAHSLHQFGGIVPLLNLLPDQKDNALIIGPGGGRDVVLALNAGFRNITAVEINPQTVEIVKEWKDYNGGIYSDFNNVNVVVAEGRNFLRHSTESFDLITMFMPITKSSRSLDAFALSENFLFTSEAFVDYHRHLTDEGTLLIMGHNLEEIVKVMTTALEALRKEGMTVQDAMKHMYILGSDLMPLFGLRKTPLPQRESEFLHAAVHQTMFDSRLSYIPGVEQTLLRSSLSTSIDAGVPMMNSALLDLATGALSLDTLERGAGFNLVPATDDRPFFFQFTFETPGPILTVFWVSLLALGIVLVIGSSLPPTENGVGRRAGRWWLPIYIVSLGVGFIMAELILFQKIVFYLGDPSKSLALLLAALLVGSAFGSFLSQKIGGSGAIIAAILSAALLLLNAITIPFVFLFLHDSSLEVLQMTGGALLVLQGIPMGVMFPVGLRMADQTLGRKSIPWIWAINGSASVLGSALTVMLALNFGYGAGLAVAGAAYLLAAASIGLSGREERQSVPMKHKTV